MISERVIFVATTCPYCGGSVPLRHDDSADSSAADIATQFAGQQLVCWNPQCEKTFWVRRVDLRIRRGLVTT